MKARLIIADDHQMMRDGLKALIAEAEDFVIVGEAGNGKDTVALAAKLSPHLVIMDVNMPDLNGIEATRRIVEASPQTRVLALSAHPDEHLVTEMLRAGASGYLLKHTAYEELIRAIRAVTEGKKYLSPDIADAVVNTHLSAETVSNSAFAVLTERERQVLQLLAEGLSTREMADHLNVSVKTIETHRRNIMEKLQIHSVAELTKYAIREGITSLEG